jgi:hypothetical protein
LTIANRPRIALGDAAVPALGAYDAGHGPFGAVGNAALFRMQSAEYSRPCQSERSETTMSRDTLSDLLRVVRLRGALFFYVEAADPWVVENPHSSELISAIMPGVEHLMEFHGVARGSCWASIVGE